MFFVCTKRINVLILKSSSDRLVIVAKGFLNLLSLHMLIKQKTALLPRNLAPMTFGELLLVLSSASDKAKLCVENFSKNSNDSSMFLLVFPSRTNLKLYNISVAPKMVKKVTMDFDLSKASGPD